MSAGTFRHADKAQIEIREWGIGMIEKSSTGGWAPRRTKQVKTPDYLKQTITSKAAELIQTHLRPTFIKPPPKNANMNYVIDIWSKWHGNSFYFCATFASPGLHAVCPTFELRFAKMSYKGNQRFNLAYMRHNDQWIEIYYGISVEECLTAVRDDPYFQL